MSVCRYCRCIDCSVRVHGLSPLAGVMCVLSPAPDCSEIWGSAMKCFIFLRIAKYEFQPVTETKLLMLYHQFRLHLLGGGGGGGGEYNLYANLYNYLTRGLWWFVIFEKWQSASVSCESKAQRYICLWSCSCIVWSFQSFLLLLVFWSFSVCSVLECHLYVVNVFWKRDNSLCSSINDSL